MDGCGFLVSTLFYGNMLYPSAIQVSKTFFFFEVALHVVLQVKFFFRRWISLRTHISAMQHLRPVTIPEDIVFRYNFVVRIQKV